MFAVVGHKANGVRQVGEMAFQIKVLLTVLGSGQRAFILAHPVQGLKLPETCLG